MIKIVCGLRLESCSVLLFPIIMAHIVACADGLSASRTPAIGWNTIPTPIHSPTHVWSNHGVRSRNARPMLLNLYASSYDDHFSMRDLRALPSAKISLEVAFKEVKYQNYSMLKQPRHIQV